MTTIILSDQFTKGIIQSNFILGESLPVIDGFFNITYVQNPGAAWGMGSSFAGITRYIFLLYLPVCACFWLVHLIWTERRTKSILACLSYSLILAGAIGNLIDRFSLGHVVDFLDFYLESTHFPAFNIADSSITIGACLMILFSFKWPKETSPK